MDILYSRDGATAETTLTPAYNDQLNRYALGVTKQLETTHETLSVGQAFQQSTYMTIGMSTIIFDAVIDLVTGRTAVNDEEGGLSGPVGIVNAIGDSVDQGIWSVVSLIAVLSVNFGLLAGQSARHDGVVCADDLRDLQRYSQHCQLTECDPIETRNDFLYDPRCRHGLGPSCDGAVDDQHRFLRRDSHAGAGGAARCSRRCDRARGGAGYGRCAGCCRGGASRQRADRRRCAF